MNDSTRYSIPRLYYFVTPAFILLDYVWGINVRVAVLDEMPLYKNLYYGLCILCGVIVFVRPRLSALVALAESSVILLLTLVGVFWPYVQIAMLPEEEFDAALAGCSRRKSSTPRWPGSPSNGSSISSWRVSSPSLASAKAIRPSAPCAAACRRRATHEKDNLFETHHILRCCE